MNATPPRDHYGEAVEYLLELKRQGVSLGLERIERLLAALGRPQASVPCIHIAGTNGKGSVAAMLEAIFRAAGYRTGLYTSPHLVRLGERIQVNRQILPAAELASAVRELRGVVADLEHRGGPAARPSYFEFMTALALRHFARSGCGIAVIEAGLGGRLDATNVVAPEVSVITSIGLDHQEVLGHTIAEIAAEKAGIVKAGRPVVIGLLPPEAEEVVRRTARARGAPLWSVAAEFGGNAASHPRTNLAGNYQRWNAATATLAARTVAARFHLTGASLAEALSNVDWPARWQRFDAGDRRVILDTSHNAEGAAVLDANLAGLATDSGRAPIIVAGVLGETRAAPLLEVFCRHARELHLVVPAQSRACRFEQLAERVPASYRGKVLRGSVAEIFPEPNRCTVGDPGDTVVVAGSIYLAGEVLARLDPRRGPHEGNLQDW